MMLAVLGAAGSQGCAAIGLALLSAGAGTAAGHGVAYTLDSIVYKTFAAPLEELESAVLTALERMDIEIRTRDAVEAGRMITARAGDRDVEIEIDRLTARASRLRVNARLNWFVKDRATAFEIITQTAQALDEQTQLAQRPTPAPATHPAAARPTKTPAPSR